MSVPESEWFYTDARPYPVLNDLLIVVIQDLYNGGVIGTYAIESSNSCQVRKRNGESCQAKRFLGKGFVPSTLL